MTAGVDWDRLLRYVPAFEFPDLESGEVAGIENEHGTLVTPWASEDMIDFEQDVAKANGRCLGRPAVLPKRSWIELSANEFRVDDASDA